MEQLEEYQVPECIRESMDQLRVYVADVSMEEIMELTDNHDRVIAGLREVYYGLRTKGNFLF